MSEPRFYTVFLTGYPAIGTDTVSTTGYVLDRAYCHRVVATYRQTPGSNPGMIGGRTRAQMVERVHRDAETEAARLNAWANEQPRHAEVVYERHGTAAELERERYGSTEEALHEVYGQPKRRRRRP